MRPKTAPHLFKLLIAVGLVVSLFTFNSPPQAYAAGNISGTVFQDFSGDGLFNTVSTAALPAVDVGVAGVTITAYDALGNIVATATSTATGAYTLTSAALTALPAGTPLRIQFTNLPANYQPGAQGASNATSVRFVTTTAGALNNVDFGINIPEDYCQNNPRLATNCYITGDQAGANTVMYTQPSIHAANVVGAPATGLANESQANQIGTTWGLAYHRRSNTLFASAYIKRLAGLAPAAQHPGSDGTGAIYRITPGGAADGALFLDLDVLFGNAALTGNIGARDYNPVNGDNNFDAGAYDAVGKMGLGDLDISADDTLLFVINLADGRLYRLPLGNGANPVAPTLAQVTSVDVPDPGCANGVGRPFGVKVRRGRVFVGGICTAENAAGAAANLRAYVYSIDLNLTAWSAALLNFQLNYPRGCADIGGYNPDLAVACRGAIVDASDANWQPWRNAVDPTFPGGYGDGFLAQPQPMLTDIEFVGNDIVLGFRDRFSDQIGWNDVSPDQTPPGLPPAPFENLNAVPAGDVLRACWNGAAYLLEANGACGGQTNGAGNEQGLGAPTLQTAPGGEYYTGEALVNFHDELVWGGLAQVPGFPAIAMTAADAADNLFTGGTIQLDNVNGTRTRSYQIYAGAAINFQKANGLGDLEALCRAAPIEIGNRVWHDDNRNGVQDPGEPPIQGVTVRLYTPGGPDGNVGTAGDNATPIAVAVTNANGEYYFRSVDADGNGFPDADPNLNDEFGLVGNNTAAQPGTQPNTQYTIRVDNAANYNLGGPLDGLGLTEQNDAVPSPGGSDLNDSDAAGANANGIPGGNFPEIVLTTGGPGANNHTYDMGFNTSPMSLGNRVWYDVNNNGIVDATETGIANVTVNLYRDNNNDGVPDGGIIATTTTNATGHYLFTNLSAGTYIVEVVTPAGYRSSTGTNGAAAGLYEPAPDPDNDTDNDDNGAIFSASAVRSAPVTLTVGLEPTGEGATPGLPDTTPDNSSNVTVDFGFFQPVSLGNLVWNDLNNDGLFNGAEAGIQNVVVNLYFDSNNNGVLDGAEGAAIVATDTTDAAGLYLFDNLVPGNYVVEIAASNFNGGGVLVGYTSSTGANGSLTGPYEAAPDPDVNAADNDDNGAINGSLTTGGIRSAVVTLTVGGEPLTETPDNDPNTPNANENLTVDFGVFQPMSLGNRVWFDANNNGVIDDGATPGLSGVTVRLFNGAGTVLLSTTVTNATGHYLFTNLAAGDYVVEVVTPAGRTSSTGGVGNPYEPAPDADANPADNDDNGTTASATTVRSATVTLAPGAEPLGEGATPGLTDPASDANSNTTVDFGFFSNTPTVSLGNQVWNDANNNGAIDGGEVGVNGVVVNLYRDTNGNGVLDGAENTTIVLQTTTVGGGLYLFDNLTPGNYVVELAASNFSGAGVLVGYTSSTGTVGSAAGPVEPAPDPDANPGDNNDNGAINGALTTGGIRSAMVTLTVGGEPTGENPDNDPNTPDANENLTVDFGVFQPMSLGNLIWIDANNNGTVDGGETGIPNLTVRLYDGIGVTLLATTTANATGNYLFTNLVPADYVVEVVTPNGYTTSTGTNSSAAGPYEPAPDPDNNVNNDDNGTFNTAATVRSSPVTLTLGTEPLGEGATPGLTDTAADNNSNTTVDFGFYQPVSLGNLVWNDSNNNGVVNGAEAGIAGVTVNLYDSTGAVLIAATATNATGNYLFTNLFPGTYVVEVVTPAGFRSSTGTNASTAGPYEPAPDPDANPANNDDNGTINSPTTVRSAPVTLTVGGEPVGEGATPGLTDTSADNSSNTTVDFGFFQPVSLGNEVWEDANNDGVINVAETPINGVTVQLLYDANGDGNLAGAELTPLATTTTAGGGLYLFNNLAPGNYTVQLAATNFTGAGTLVGSSSSTGGGSEPAPDPDTDQDDNDDNGSTVGALGAGGVIRSAMVTLTAGGEPLAENPDNDPTTPDANENLTVDFGVFTPLSLGNLVWRDANNNGVVDGGETGIGGVTVNLYDAAGVVLLATTLTDANGNYLFTNLAPGSYIVEVVTPAGYTSSTDIGTSVNPNNDVNNDDNGVTVTATTVRSNQVALARGAEPINDGDTSPNSNLSVDFGFYSPLSLGNQVWNDVNNNGLIDGGEVGINGVTINLYFDSNNNGLLDGAEGTTVVATTTTAGGGLYLFTGLTAGNYVVELPATNFAGAGRLVSYRSSTGINGSATGPYEGPLTPDPDTGGALAPDNDDNGTTNAGAVRSALVTLSSGGEPLAENPDNDPNTPDANENLTVDFGVFQPLSLGNRVWADLNDSGAIDAADGATPGLANITVRLLNSAGATIIATTTTNATGHYLFTNLAPGDYVVEVVTPAGATSSTGGAGTPNEPAPDADANPNDNDDNGTTASATAVRSAPVTLTVGGEPLGEGATPGLTDNATDANSNTTVDFGFVTNTPRVSLGNEVWVEANNNGLIDGGEVGINGVVVNLYFDSNNNGALDGAEATTIVATTTTAGGGLYLFSGLLPGNYLIELAPSNFTGAGVLVGYTSSTGANGSAAGLFEPAPDPDANAADNDDNGTINGVLGVAGSIRSALVTLTVGGEPLTENPDNDPTTPDANENLTVDFGVFQPLSLGNLVWNDVDDSGAVNGGEVGIGGLTVRLFDGAGAVQLATTITNASGHYLFTNLTPGDYVIEVVAPAGFTSSTGGAGTPYEPAPDPDANPANNDDNGTLATATTVRSAAVTLTLGGEPLGEGPTPGLTDLATDANSNTTVDFGFNTATGNLSLGNLVWNDANNNGLFDAGTEAGIPNVTVTLYDATGAIPIATTTTDAAGNYLFTGLAPGSYVVEVVTPAGFVSSTDIATSGTPNNDVNNDDNGVTVAAATVRSSQVTLTAGGEPINDGDADANSNLSVDFGFHPQTTTLSLGNLVWEDQNNNGVVDAGEPGLGLVTVNLYNDTNNNGLYDAGVDTFLAMTNTNGVGNYLFVGLNPGNYLVVVDATSPALAGFTSSTGPAGNPYEPAPDPDNDVNNDDNGTAQGSLVIARAVTLTPNGEPVTDGDTDNNSNLSLDFGFFNSPTVSLGNLVWLDLNNDGNAGGGEPGVGGVPLRLYRDTNGSGVFDAGIDQLAAATTTNATGIYQFSSLQPGGYFVETVVPVGYTSTTDTANTGNPNSDTDSDDNGVGTGAGTLVSGLVTLTVGGEPAGGGNFNPTLDFGLALAAPPLSLGNLVWTDVNNNGLVDAGETGIDNVLVNLYLDGNNDGVPDGGVIATQLTNAAGNYLFDNLAPGTYIVEAVTPAGLVTSTGDNGSAAGPYEPAPDPDNDINNDDNGAANGGVARSRPVTLTSGGEPINDGDADADSNLSLDFGFFQPLQLGNLAWRDANNNGMVDGAETGLPGVTARLYEDVNGNGAFDAGDTLTAATTTDAGGNYLFTKLIPGNYLVEVVTPAGFVSSTDIPTSADPNNATDGDDNGVNFSGLSAFSGGVNLAADNLRVDFGFFGSAPPPPPGGGSGGGGGGGGGASGGGGQPVVLILDPLLAKSPDLQTVQQGEAVQFTITVTNPGTVSIANVVVTDPLPAQITFTGATTTLGAFTFDAVSNTVAFNIGTMGAGDVVTLTVSGVANQNAKAPEAFRNTALLFVNGEQRGSSNSVEVQVTPGGIPNTGNGPGWREWLAVLILSLIAMTLPVVAWRVRRRVMK